MVLLAEGVSPKLMRLTLGNLLRKWRRFTAMRHSGVHGFRIPLAKGPGAFRQQNERFSGYSNEA